MRVCLVGNLGQDPELRLTPQGTPVARLSVAETTRRKTSNGAWQNTTQWWDVEVWGGQAENVAENLQKGHRVIVWGDLKIDTYERDGQRRRSYRIRAEEIGVSLFRQAVTIARYAPEEESSEEIS